MQVWMRICRRKATCKHCPKPILKGQPMVVCRYYKSTRKKKGDPTNRWAFTIRFHPECWIAQGLAALKEKPVVETRGRKKAPMTDEMRAARVKVLARRAAVVMRIKLEVEKPDGERNVGRIIKYGGQLNQLKEEIEPLGGVPKSWV
jgi:hypothetical protein